MRKFHKIILGIFTFMPIILLITYFIVFIGIFLGTFNEIQNTGFGDTRHEPMSDPEVFFGNFIWVFAIILTMLVVNLGLLIFYIIHIFKNPKFEKDSNMRIIWVLLMIFGSLVGSIIYYFLEIYPLPNEKSLIPEAK